MALVFVVTGHALLFELVDYRQMEFEDYFKKPADIKAPVKFTNNASEKIEYLKKMMQKTTVCKPNFGSLLGKAGVYS